MVVVVFFVVVIVVVDVAVVVVDVVVASGISGPCARIPVATARSGPGRGLVCSTKKKLAVARRSSPLRVGMFNIPTLGGIPLRRIYPRFGG